MGRGAAWWRRDWRTSCSSDSAGASSPSASSASAARLASLGSGAEAVRRRRVARTGSSAVSGVASPACSTASAPSSSAAAALVVLRRRVRCGVSAASSVSLAVERRRERVVLRAGSSCSAAEASPSAEASALSPFAAGAAVSACTGFDAGSAVGGSLKSGPCSSTLSSTVAPAAPAPRTTRRPVRRRRGAAGCSLVDEESVFDAVSSGSKPCSVCSGTMLLLVAPCCNLGALVLAPCGLTPYSHHGRAVTAPAGSNPKVKSCGNGHRRSRN